MHVIWPPMQFPLHLCAFITTGILPFALAGDVHQSGASCFLGSVCIKPRDKRVPCISEAFTSLCGDLFLVFLGLFTLHSHEAKVNWASNKVAVK
jgi:hypothetical protein